MFILRLEIEDVVIAVVQGQSEKSSKIQRELGRLDLVLGLTSLIDGDHIGEF